MRGFRKKLQVCNCRSVCHRQILLLLGLFSHLCKNKVGLGTSGVLLSSVYLILGVGKVKKVHRTVGSIGRGGQRRAQVPHFLVEGARTKGRSGTGVLGRSEGGGVFIEEASVTQTKELLARSQRPGFELQRQGFSWSSAFLV